MNLIGFDIGGTKCAVVLGKTHNPEDGIVIADKIAFPTKIGPEATLKEIFDAAHTIISRNGLTSNEIDGIGINCGGPLDSKRGVIMSPPNLPGWDDVHIVEMTEKEFGIKAYVQNDANAGAMAEWMFGAGRGYDNVLFFTFGTGLGSGFILDGHLYSGTTDMAGEVGHIRLSQNGPVGFGKEGSFEGWCSGGGIAQLAQTYARKRIQNGQKVAYCPTLADLPSVTAKSVAEAAFNGDETAIEVYKVMSEQLGRGLSTIIDILNPEVIVLGSIYVRSAALIEEHMWRIIKEESISHAASVVKIVPAQLSENIGDMSALVLAIEASKKK